MTTLLATLIGVVRVTLSCTAAVNPFFFDPDVNANVFDLPGDLRPEHAHVLIRSQVGLGTGTPVTVYQDSAFPQQFYVEPQSFRLSRSDQPPHRRDPRMLFLDVVQAGEGDAPGTLGYRVQISFRFIPSLDGATRDRVRQTLSVQQAGASVSLTVLRTAELSEADLDIFYEEADTGYERRHSVTINGGGSPLVGQVVTIPAISPETGGATYQLTVARTDGCSFHSDMLELTHDTVIVSDGAGSAHRVKLRLVGGDLAAAGLAAVPVQLRSAGDSGEALFLQGQPPDRTIALAQPGEQPFSYDWEIEGYTLADCPRGCARDNRGPQPHRSHPNRMNLHPTSPSKGASDD